MASSRLLLLAAAILAARVLPASAQTITEFPLHAGSQPGKIVTGPDGNLALPAGGSITVSVEAGSAIVYGATVDNRTGDPSLQIATP